MGCFWVGIESKHIYWTINFEVCRPSCDYVVFFVAIVKAWVCISDRKWNKYFTFLDSNAKNGLQWFRWQLTKYSTPQLYVSDQNRMENFCNPLQPPGKNVLLLWDNLRFKKLRITSYRSFILAWDDAGFISWQFIISSSLLLLLHTALLTILKTLPGLINVENPDQYLHRMATTSINKKIGWPRLCKAKK